MRLRVCDKVMTSQGDCTSGTSRVLTLASLQRLKMEAHTPAPADCEVRSVIKFLKYKWRGMLSAGVVLCTITLGHTRIDGQHISYRSSAGNFSIIRIIARISFPVICIFSCASKNSCPVSVSVFRMAEKWRSVSQ